MGQKSEERKELFSLILTKKWNIIKLNILGL